MKLFRNLRLLTGQWSPFFLFTKNKLLRNSPGSDFTCWIATCPQNLLYFWIYLGQRNFVTPYNGQKIQILGLFFPIFWIKFLSYFIACGACLTLTWKRFLTKGCPFDLSNLWNVEVRWFSFSYHSAFVFVALF